MSPQQDTNSTSPANTRGSIPPPPPKPSADNGARYSIPNPSSDPGHIPLTVKALDITTLSPTAALKLLTLSIKSALHADSQSLSTPTFVSPLPRVTQGLTVLSSSSVTSISQDITSENPAQMSSQLREIPCQHRTPIGSPETHATIPDATGRDLSDLYLDDPAAMYTQQCKAIASSFRSKLPPPISLPDYLQRIHKYCPMSTAVYLTAAHYIQRLTHSLWPTTSSSPSSSSFTTTTTTPSSISQLPICIEITPLSIHRLTLAAVRVANKACEDSRWPQDRFAGVGGVSNANLTRLELAVCFLLDFELYVGPEELEEVARWMVRRQGRRDAV